MRATMTGSKRPHGAAILVVAALSVLAGCGRISLGPQVGEPVGSEAPQTTPTSPAPTPASTRPPVTTAPPAPTTAAPTTAATETSTVATPPPGNQATHSGSAAGSSPSGPTISFNADWANATYPIDCLDSGDGPVVLVGGTQQTSASAAGVYAELRSTVPAGSGSTIVWLFCEVSSRVNGMHAVLVAPNGTLVDDLGVGPVYELDGLWYTTPEYESWQTGNDAFDAASVRVHNLAVSGSGLSVSDGEITPKCAPIGPERLDYGPGRVNQGNLVRAFQRRLIDLGYGAEINASGGADGFIGRGTMEAFNRYFAANFDYNDFGSPAQWLGNEDGVAWVNWLSAEWTQVLGIDCVGDYQPPGD